MFRRKKEETPGSGNTTAEVVADYETREVVTRYLDQDTGLMVMEVRLSPDLSREYALNLSMAAIAIEQKD